ncbi:Hsp20 family protein [Idiomarina xiamenensis]|uniref:Moleculcr chaperone Hsp20 n=1 Tax=Idiomarina xiamenensis 10-D-4 TaxID=740709 RepID=K2JM34_9GAMM|nr:Hsp20 family protein [Idiomarina xiamenensis]EKE84561.1 moleculcr chaperone Hsp20 [Idiomarina xiamenensis 10-D-4]
MATIDLSPLYRSSVGFDRMASLLDAALRSDTSASGYPPYNIESTGENQYVITLAVAGFAEDELELEVENGVLRVQGKKADDGEQRKYLHKGIAFRGFERKFSLAEHVEITGAKLENGLLAIGLVKRIPEAMKAKRIAIGQSLGALENNSDS